MTHALASLAVAGTLLLTASPASAQARELPSPKGGPAGQVGLSDDFTVTRWAHAAKIVPVRAWPSSASSVRAYLHFSAPNGSREVYVVRSEWLDAEGRQWVRVRVPGPRPREGWVRRAALGRFGVSRSAIRIDRDRTVLTLYKRGRRVLRTPVGVGTPATPTPTGHFWIRGRFKVPKHKTFTLNGQTVPYSVYGPRILLTTASSREEDWPGGGIIGIHGTNQPWLLPGRPSHGCVRLTNKMIRALYKRVQLGTPVDIE